MIAGIAGFLRKIVREPLVHFLLVGLLIYGAAEYWQAHDERYRIEISSDDVSSIKAAYAAEFGTEPDKDTLGSLIEEHVIAEVLFREGMARGLDRGDEIIRRRVIQKASFLEEGRDVIPEPTESQLAAWYEEHRSDYAGNQEIGFSHVFFAASPGEVETVKERAVQALAGLPDVVKRAPDRGDAFPDLYDYTGFSQQDASRIFGSSEIASALFDAPVGTWSGPYRSAYGWHLVRVSERSQPRAPVLSEIREKVHSDYMEQARGRADLARLRELVSHYDVVRRD